MKYLGCVLWVSEKDNNSIIRDFQGNEWYFDCSVSDTPIGEFKTGDLVSFNHTKQIKETLCARDVEIVSKGNKVKIENGYGLTYQYTTGRKK